MNYFGKVSNCNLCKIIKSILLLLRSSIFPLDFLSHIELVFFHFKKSNSSNYSSKQLTKLYSLFYKFSVFSICFGSLLKCVPLTHFSLGGALEFSTSVKRIHRHLLLKIQS